MTEYEEEEVQDQGYQVLVTGITWNPKKVQAHPYKGVIVRDYDIDQLPGQFAIDLPENVLNQAARNVGSFEDVIETFVYNFLTHKYGHEVYSCSVWLPLVED